MCSLTIECVLLLQGKGTLEHYVDIAVRLLRSGAEGSAAAAAEIIVQLFLRCRAEVSLLLCLYYSVFTTLSLLLSLR